MNVLIIRSQHFGGILMATRIAKAIRTKYRTARIAWLTCQHGSDIVSHCQSINDFDTEPANYHKILWDILILPSVGNENDLKTASTIKCKNTIGLKLNKSGRHYVNKDSYPFFKILKDRKYRADLGMSSEKYCIANLGIDPLNVFYDYRLLPNEANKARSTLHKITNSKNKIIGLHFGSSLRWDSKKLPLNYILSLLSELIKNIPNHSIVVFVGPREEEFIEINLKSFEKFENVFLLRNRSLNEVIAIINLLDLVISTDSFIMHAALATETKVIALFGPTSIKEIDFFNIGFPLSLKLECSPCFAKQKSQCENIINLKCINELPVSEIIHNASAILSGNE